MHAVNVLIRTTLLGLLFSFINAAISPTQVGAQAVIELPAQETDKAAGKASARSGSLMRVPASAGYYLATMNHQTLVDRIFQSNAWRSIKSTDVARGMKKAYRRGKSRGYDDYNLQNPFTKLLQGYSDSIGSVPFQSVWQIAREVVKDELFVYVDNDALPVAKAIQNFQVSIYSAIPTDLKNDDFDEERFIDQLIKSARVNFTDIECPTILLGARLEDPDGFRGMLELARSMAEQGMKSYPYMFDSIKPWWNVTDQENNYLLALDIPLSDLPMEDLMDEVDDPQIEDLIAELLADKTASIVLGIVDDLLIIGIAADKEKLIQFGDGPRLLDTPFLKRLKQSVTDGDTITGVGYLSPEFCEFSYSFDSLLKARGLLAGLLSVIVEDLDEEERRQWYQSVEAGIVEFVDDFQDVFPSPKSFYGYATLDDEGIHMFSRTKKPALSEAADEPSRLVKHAGPGTVGFIVDRPKALLKRYNFVAKWTRRIFGDFPDQLMTSLVDEILFQLEEARDQALADGNEVPEQPTWEDAKEVLAEMMNEFKALGSEFDSITRQQLLPEMVGQELGLFLGMQSGPLSWCADMPASEAPLAIPLPALVVGVKDSAAVVKAGENYFDLANRTLEFIKQSSAKLNGDDEELNAIQIPQPERLVDGDDVSFRWNLLTTQGGFDPSLRSGGRVSKNWLVLNVHPEQAKDLTTPKPTNRVFGPAASDVPASSLLFYDNRVAAQYAAQWIDYSYKLARANGNWPVDLSHYEARRDTLQFTDTQLRQWFQSQWDMATCFKGLSSRTYKTSDGVATDWLLKFEDIAAIKK